MRQLNPYPDYVDSGVEWLARVPAHWATEPIGKLFTERRTTVSDADFQPLSVTRAGIVPQLENVAKTDNGDGRKLVKSGDFAINSRSDRKGSSGISDRDGSVSVITTVLTPRTMAQAYIHHLLRSEPFQEEFYRYGSGIVADLWSTRWSAMKSIQLVVPPLEEQLQIATFLDRETAEIDAFIADQEELIGLLAERRAATISHAVTKGLDPNVPMKDSGVAWLGEVPLHWTTQRIKEFVGVPVTDGPHSTPEILDSGVLFVSAEAVGSGVLNLERARGFISPEDNALFAKKYRPQRGDIYMVKSGATTGVVAIVDTDVQFNIWSPLAAIRCGSLAHPRFVMYAMKSSQFRESVELHWSFGTQQNIGMGVIENLPIPFPTVEEQRSIAHYLDRETAELDAAIGDAREAIALSHERRAALISAAVTGKIDLREHGAVT